MDHQRLLALGDPQGTLGVVAGEDAPQQVGVRIVVEPSREPIDRGHELAAGLGRRGHEAGVAGELLPQIGQASSTDFSKTITFAPCLATRASTTAFHCGSSWVALETTTL